MINFRMLKLSDWQIWLAVSILVTVGLLAIFSTTFAAQLRLSADTFIFVKRQLLALVMGIIGLAGFAYLDYQHLKKAAPYVYAVIILLLAMVLFTGAGSSGAQRWIFLGPLSFQPSEVSKLGLIIVLAAFFSERQRLRSFWEGLFLIFLIGLPFLLVFKQPDLGTALVFGAILLGMLVASEASPRLLLFLATPIVSILLRPLLFLWIIYLLGLVIGLFLSRAKSSDWLLLLGINGGVGVALPFIWGMLKVYQRQRITTFFNPAADPYGAGYHTLQSKIAIGSGGLWGKGFLRGTQTQLQFIPEQHSDFIFSAIGEELGLIGAALVLVLFAVLVWRTLVIAREARDDFGSLLAAGIAAMLTFHVLANIGMAMGILPVVGIPLPFISFGGSSLFMNLAAAGILQSIAMRRHKIIF